MSDKPKSAKTDKPSQPPPAKPVKAKSPKVPAQRAPLLLETAITLSQIVLVITGLGILGISLLAGADITMAAMRSGAAVLVVGLVLWLANWQLARGSLEALSEQMREAAEAPAAAHGELDVNA